MAGISKKTLARRLAREQNNRCWWCGELFRTPCNKFDVPTVDHVWPRSSYPVLKLKGNALAAHFRCNQKRGNEDPDALAIVMLEAVNEAMGWELWIDQTKVKAKMRLPRAMPAVLLLEMPAPPAIQVISRRQRYKRQRGRALLSIQP